MVKHQTGLNFRRQLLQKVWRHGRRWAPSDDYIRDVLHCDPASLKRAAEFFGLDHAIPADVSMLALVLADELFGERKRGRKAGNQAWDTDRFLELGFAYDELKKDYPHLSDTKLAELLVDIHEFKEYRNNPELIRQRLSRAKRELQEWSIAYGEDWAANYRDDEDALCTGHDL